MNERKNLVINKKWLSLILLPVLLLTLTAGLTSCNTSKDQNVLFDQVLPNVKGLHVYPTDTKIADIGTAESASAAPLLLYSDGDVDHAAPKFNMSNNQVTVIQGPVAFLLEDDIYSAQNDTYHYAYAIYDTFHSPKDLDDVKSIIHIIFTDDQKQYENNGMNEIMFFNIVTKTSMDVTETSLHSAMIPGLDSLKRPKNDIEYVKYVEQLMKIITDNITVVDNDPPVVQAAKQLTNYGFVAAGSEKYNTAYTLDQFAYPWDTEYKNTTLLNDIKSMTLTTQNDLSYNNQDMVDKGYTAIKLHIAIDSDKTINADSLDELFKSGLDIYWQSGIQSSENQKYVILDVPKSVYNGTYKEENGTATHEVYSIHQCVFILDMAKKQQIGYFELSCTAPYQYNGTVYDTITIGNMLKAAYNGLDYNLIFNSY